MAKEFKRKFIHPTRKALNKMVQTGGEYDAPQKIYGGFNGKVEPMRKVGDTWEDKDGNIVTQHEGYRSIESKNSKALTGVRKFIEEQKTCKGENCIKRRSDEKYGPNDEKMVLKTGFCTACISELEWKIKRDGNWKLYVKCKNLGNKIAQRKEVLAQLKQAKQDITNKMEYVNEDGTLEKWTLPVSVDQLKVDLSNDIETVTNAIEIMTTEWTKLYKTLKEDYEFI